MSQNTPKSEKKELSKALKFFYGVGDCGFSLMTNLESYFFNFFLTNLAAFPLAIVTMITTISSTVDALLSWIYGAILNSTKPMKWGRYRSWLLVVPWMIPFLYAFEFIRFSNMILSAVTITLGAVLSHIAWNFPYVANVSMISVAGKTPEDRSQLASTRGAWSNLSKVLFSYIGPVLAAVFAGIVGEVNQYAAAAFVLACLMAALYYAHFVMFKGYEAEVPQGAVGSKAASKDKTSPKDLVRALFQNPPLIALLIADLAKWIFNFIIMGFATYYFTYVANDSDGLKTYILITSIFCVAGSYLSKIICNKLSTRKATILVMAVMAAMLIISFVMYQNVTVVTILMSAAMLGYGIIYSCTTALYGDTIIYSEWKTGKNAAGWISGLQNAPLKIAVMSRGIIISSCLAIGVFSADIDPLAASDGLKRAISFGFMLVPAIALVIAVLILIFGFKLTKEKVEQYSAEIAAR